MAADPETASLNTIRDLSSTVQGSDVVIGVTGSTPISDYTYYDYDPETFVVDLADVDVSLLPKVLSVDQGPVREVKVESISRSKGRSLAKLEVRKSYLSKCLVTAEQNRLVIKVVGNGNEKPAAEERATAKPAPTPAAVEKPPQPSQQAGVPASAAKRLTAIVVDNDGSGVSLKADGKAEIKYFALKDPERIVVDFPGVSRGKLPDQTAGAGNIERVRVSAFKANPIVTRVVLDLKEGTKGWSVSNNGGTVLVRLGTGAGEVAEASASSQQAAPSDQASAAKAIPAAPEAPAAAEPSQAPAAAQAEVVKAEPVAPTEVKTQEIQMSQVDPSKVEKVSVQLSPVENQKSREFRGYESLFVAKDTQSTAAEGKTPGAKVVPLSFKEKTITTGKQWTGEPISLSLKNADIKDVLRLFHDISKLNVVVHPAVSGNVTVDLENVPWDQAMDIILKNNNLDTIYENNIIWVAPAAEIARKFAEQQRMNEEKLKAEDPVTFTLPMSYAKVQDMETIAKKFLSDRGSVISDKRTNQMIIQEVPSKKENLLKLITSLDSPTQQVLIEARLVETSVSWDQSFGITWGGNWWSYVETKNNVSKVYRTVPTALDTGGKGEYPVHNFLGNQNGWPNYGAGDFAVSLPPSASNGFIDLLLGNANGSFMLDVRLAAMENNGRGRILSAPKILTQDNEEATIEAGTSIPVRIATSDKLSVSFVSATLKLKVTPRITADGNISMDVEINNDSPDWGNQEPGQPPPIVKKAAKTTLKVRDGSTAVIGGIFKTTEGISQSGLPFLSKIPALGWLFKNRTKQRQNEEMLIFLTPKIAR